MVMMGLNQRLDLSAWETPCPDFPYVEVSACGNSCWFPYVWKRFGRLQPKTRCSRIDSGMMVGGGAIIG